MGNVISKALEPQTKSCMNKMELQRTPSKSQIDDNANDNIEEVVPGHSVEQDQGEDWTVASMLLSDASEFTLPHTLVGTVNFSWHICIN